MKPIVNEWNDVEANARRDGACEFAITSARSAYYLGAAAVMDRLCGAASPAELKEAVNGITDELAAYALTLEIKAAGGRQ